MRRNILNAFALIGVLYLLGLCVALMGKAQRERNDAVDRVTIANHRDESGLSVCLRYAQQAAECRPFSR